jgi:galactose mutarotase-like enzyme
MEGRARKASLRGAAFLFPKPPAFSSFIGMEPIEYEGLCLRRWRRGPSCFLARPEAGARLMNWNVRMADGSVRDVVHWPENAGAGADFARVRGGNPVLFPFAGRTWAGDREDCWRYPDGRIRPMLRHGFARDSAFETTRLDEEGFTAVLLPDAAALEAYPFDYRFSVDYRFAELGLTVTFVLENHGERPLSWAAGHHFYFTLPWHRRLGRADYRFSIPARRCFRPVPDGSLDPVKPFAAENHFGADGIEDLVFTRLKEGLIRFGPAGGEEEVGIRFLTDGGRPAEWNAVVLWTEAAESPFFCVEPWMAPPNAAGHGRGLQWVNPGGSGSFGVEVALL